LNITYLQIDVNEIDESKCHYSPQKEEQKPAKQRSPQNVQSMQNDKACKTARKATNAEIEVSRW